MNELRRSVYLQAMGVDAYVSRQQLPGAARTWRLAIVRPVCSPAAQPVAPRLTDAASARPPMPAAGISPIETGKATPAPAVAAPRPVATATPPKFSLAAISCGGWLWIEELEGAPLAPAQSQLVQAIAAALGGGLGDDDSADGGRNPARAESTQFDWPIHSNQQLDLGEDAARSSVAAFLQRRLEQPGCHGLVLLGHTCETRVPLAQLACPRLARTVSTAEMLRNPLLKKQAWRDLRTLCQPL